MRGRACDEGPGPSGWSPPLDGRLGLGARSPGCCRGAGQLLDLVAVGPGQVVGQPEVSYSAEIQDHKGHKAAWATVTVNFKLNLVPWAGRPGPRRPGMILALVDPRYRPMSHSGQLCAQQQHDLHCGFVELGDSVSAHY